MSIIALLIALFTLTVAGLIVSVAYKQWQRSNLRNKKDHLNLVDEQYQEVVLIKKEFKNSDEKEKEVKKFTNN
jgi:Flp pilus assembly protein CpaB